MEQTKNIFERMSAVATELSAVAKNLDINAGKSKYKAVGEADVLRAIKPLEAKHRVFSYPHSREIVESGTLESTDYNGNVRKQLFERIKVVYRFVNLDKTDEFVDITSYGDGIDSGDKSVGKAMTYADKYALLKAYKIVTGDDPDQEASQTLNSFKTELDKALVAEAEGMGIDISKVAIYFKKTPETLTNAELRQAIATKKRSTK